MDISEFKILDFEIFKANRKWMMKKSEFIFCQKPCFPVFPSSNTTYNNNWGVIPTSNSATTIITTWTVRMSSLRRVRESCSAEYGWCAEGRKTG